MDEIRIYDGNCDTIWQYLKPIEFKLEKTVIKINPSGYTFQEYDKTQGFCQIGLHTNGEVNSNQYRLGTVFLKNFYTGLDYDRDLIVIGVNKGSSQHASATIIGHIGDPYNKDGHSSNTILILFLILFVLFDVAAIVYFIIQKKQKEKEKKRITDEQAQGDTATDNLIEKKDDSDKKDEKADEKEEGKTEEIQKVLKDEEKDKDTTYLK